MRAQILGLWYLFGRLPAVAAVRRTPPAEVRRHHLPRLQLSLSQPYYLARGSQGYELLPKDAYLEEVEALLSRLGPRE